MVSNCGHPWMTTVTVASTDTLTDGVRQGVYSRMVHRWSVIVVHPWMVHGWSMDDHSNYGIHGYFNIWG